MTVGKKPSNAEYYLEDPVEVEETLKTMTKVGAQQKVGVPRSYSPIFGSRVRVYVCT